MTVITKKVIISQPMFGRSVNDILKQRTEAEAVVRKVFAGCDVQFINSVTDSSEPEDAGRVFKLGRAIQLLEEADIVYFCRDWEFANGCRIEKKVCDLYGIPYFCEND